MPPDPLNDSAAFDDFVHSSICSFGIHSHDKSMTSRCHKPPKGLMRCALSKPSGIVEQTMPVQLVDTTQPPKKHTEKITINYQVRHYSEIQTRMEAIQNLPPRLQVGPLFRQNDQRLIVYEPKRPALTPLPELQEDSNKKWVLANLMAAMNAKSYPCTNGSCVAKDQKWHKTSKTAPPLK
jgi:hypothetical protein